ncbi:MAG: alkaline phosphatase, partial [Candidatus Eisenbacteria bacterium]|nr:alkaline phosphatase [Candidatus Eisenbacteria bacterium]
MRTTENLTSAATRLTTVSGLAIVLAALCIVLTAGCASSDRLAGEPARRSLAGTDAQPANIILMIGDGMGVSQITAARIELGHLNMERLPVGGLVTTFAGNRLVTDSAASGTALATGHK